MLIGSIMISQPTETRKTRDKNVTEKHGKKTAATRNEGLGRRVT